MKKPSKKFMLISFGILVVVVGIIGSIILHKRGLDGDKIAVMWLLYFVAIIGLADLIFLIIRPAIKILQGKDDPPPEFAGHPPPNV